jgi:mannose-6-phosphate isomerase-like protein (cupin superfamily)
MCAENLTRSHHPFVIELSSQESYTSLLNEENTHKFHSGLVTLQPGQSCGEHSTESCEEVLIILQGNGVADFPDLGESIEISNGKLVYIPPRTRHNVHNQGESHLRYIYLVTKVLE